MKEGVLFIYKITNCIAWFEKSCERRMVGYGWGGWVGKNFGELGRQREWSNNNYIWNLNGLSCHAQI